MAQTRVLIVDDHPLVRRGLRALIDGEPDLRVCAEAATHHEGLAAIVASRPHLVIADLSLGDSDGLEMVKDIRASHGNLPVLVLSIMLMLPFIILAERKRKTKQVFLFAIAMLALGLFGIGELASGKWGLVGWLLLFFAAFNLLEASLPSLISKIAPASPKKDWSTLMSDSKASELTHQRQTSAPNSASRSSTTTTDSSRSEQK